MTHLSPGGSAGGSLCNYIMQDGCCGGGAPNVSQTRPPSLSVLQRLINKSISAAPERRAIFCCHHRLVSPLIFTQFALSFPPSLSPTLPYMHITHGNKAPGLEGGRCIFDCLRRQRFTHACPSETASDRVFARRYRVDDSGVCLINDETVESKAGQGRTAWEVSDAKTSNTSD